MCDVLDKVENRGIEKGIVKGESRGENKMALLVKTLLDHRYSERSVILAPAQAAIKKPRA